MRGQAHLLSTVAALTHTYPGTLWVAVAAAAVLLVWVLLWSAAVAYTAQMPNQASVLCAELALDPAASGRPPGPPVPAACPPPLCFPPLAPLHCASPATSPDVARSRPVISAGLLVVSLIWTAQLLKAVVNATGA